MGRDIKVLMKTTREIENAERTIKSIEEKTLQALRIRLKLIKLI